MSLTEIKRAIRAMTDEERFLAAAFLRVLGRQDDPEYRRSMADRLDRMAEGAKPTLDQAKRMHAALQSEGL